MKTELSSYLRDKRPAAKRLLELLLKRYDYVSILATDVSGTDYDVSTRTVTVEDSLWSERGFCVRVQKDGVVTEYAFDDFSKSPEAMALLIAEKLGRFWEFEGAYRYLPIPDDPAKNVYQAEVGIAPDAIAPEIIISRLALIRDQVKDVSPLLVNMRIFYEGARFSKFFLSRNRDLEQSYWKSMAFALAICAKDGETQCSFVPASGMCGFEVLGRLIPLAKEAVLNAESLFGAEMVVPGMYDIILSPEVAGVIAHEAFGHGVETDMFAKNRARASDYLGKRVGSNLVTMRDGAVSAMNSGSFFFDDEGTLAQDTTVIKNGILLSGISDTLSALRLGFKATGNGRRESFSHKAYARMTNTVFSKGNSSLKEMIASIKKGYLIEEISSGMEDPRSWGIQVIACRGHEIVDGKLTGEIVSPLILSGYVPDVLGAVTMTGNSVEISGAGICGKGHKEKMMVSDGGPFMKTRMRLG